MPTIKQQGEEVHVCPICDKAHFNNQEHLSICAKCFRENRLDLAFVEWAINDGKLIEDALDAHGAKFIKQIEKREEEYLARATKNLRTSKMYSRLYILMMMYWLGYWLGVMIF